MVSVIIPTYKRAKYIERAINSVLNQTYTEYEVIVVDDNNPNTEDRIKLQEIMKKYEDNHKVIYIQHEKNKNGAAARNTGIKIAKGEYITFLDDDDYYLPERLEKLVNILDKNTEFNGIFSGVIIVKNKKIIKVKRAIKKDNYILELLKQKSFFGTGSNMFFRARALKEINGFDETFKRNQDLEVMIRFLRNNKIEALDEPLVVKNQDDRSNEMPAPIVLEIRELFLKRFQQDIKSMPSKEKEIYVYNYYSVITYSILKKDFKTAKKVKEKLTQYTNISLKIKLKFIIYFIDSYINIIIRGFTYFQNIHDINKLNEQIKEFIRKVEND